MQTVEKYAYIFFVCLFLQTSIYIIIFSCLFQQTADIKIVVYLTDIRCHKKPSIDSVCRGTIAQNILSGKYPATRTLAQNRSRLFKTSVMIHFDNITKYLFNLISCKPTQEMEHEKKKYQKFFISVQQILLNMDIESSRRANFFIVSLTLL